MPGVKPYSAYDQFAWFYSQGWGEEFHKQARAVFERHVYPRLPSRARVLDLCCGTGDLSRELVGRGYQVTGIDGSEEMLRYARERVLNAEFIHADAREFEIAPSFDAAFSTFDSLNHILTLGELAQAFANVARALVPGGLFVFDMNLQDSFETLWQGEHASIEDTCVAVTRGSYDVAKKTGRAEVIMFRLVDGAWQRSDICVLEKCYSEEELLAALARAGFSEMEVKDAYEAGMRGDIALGRAFFFAVK
jgi:SAM-dependent methyltransferase